MYVLDKIVLARRSREMGDPIPCKIVACYYVFFLILYDFENYITTLIVYISFSNWYFVILLLFHIQRIHISIHHNEKWKNFYEKC